MLSDQVEIEALKALPQFVIGIGTILAAIFGYLAQKNSKEAATQARITEQNTNHIKDELVAEVRKASIRVGRDLEKLEALDRDASYQSGKQAEREGN